MGWCGSSNTAGPCLDFLRENFSICYLPLGQSLNSKWLCFYDFASSFVRERVYSIPRSTSWKLMLVNLTFCEQKLVSRGCLFIRNKTQVILGTVFQ